MLKRVRQKLRAQGLLGLLAATARYLVPAPPIDSWQVVEPLVRGRHGLELGGPSRVFGRRGLLPVYACAQQIDNCNFSSSTTWEPDVQEGWTFHFDGRKNPGLQRIVEASALVGCPSGSYDFVLSSHVVEHLANPLGALADWRRVLKPGGLLLLIIPHRDATFDHRRPITKLAHLIADCDRAVGEDDLTHLEEILELHDLGRDPAAGSPQQFKRRSMLNMHNRCLHHHVFNTRLATAMVDHAGFEILAVEARRPMHIVVIARNADPAEAVCNDRFLGHGQVPAWKSPFPSDH